MVLNKAEKMHDPSPKEKVELLPVWCSAYIVWLKYLDVKLAALVC